MDTTPTDQLLNQLRTDPPRSGRVIRENGGVINTAESYDPWVDANSSIDSIHANIHKGIVFNLSRRINLTGNQVVYFVGITKENAVHFNRFSYSANQGGIEIRLLKDVVYTDGTGTSTEGINRNTLSDKVSTLEIIEGATVTNTGTQLHLTGLPSPASGGTPSRIPQTEDDFEWLLKPYTQFALEIKELDNNAKILYADMMFYEPGLLA